MSTALTTLDFKAVRLNAKGKETYRDMVGTLLSGNPAERVRAAESLLATDWATGNMVSTVSNLRRIFTEKKVEKLVSDANDHIMYFNARCDESAKRGKIDLDTPKKLEVLEIMQALINGGKELKGEKAKMVGIIDRIAKMEETRAAEKLAREEQFKIEAALAASTNTMHQPV